MLEDRVESLVQVREEREVMFLNASLQMDSTSAPIFLG
jgi:hypothetical protein